MYYTELISTEGMGDYIVHHVGNAEKTLQCSCR